MVVIVASESGSGNSFATSRTAASLASMPASCIIILPPSSSSSSFEETVCVAGGQKKFSAQSTSQTQKCLTAQTSACIQLPTDLISSVREKASKQHRREW
jgi:hypothetical protein